MSFSTALALILISTLALSYGWGMRGLLIGGEKGAMLPGALLGILLAWFSGSAVIRDNYWIFAAVGLIGMTFGGTETYGETIGMVLKRGKPEFNPVKGYTGLAFKGALWFSVCGGFVAMAFSAMTGVVYKWYDFVIMFVAMPLIQEIGYRCFNRPYDKAAGKYPKIFFSVTRREEWGRNVGVLLEIVVFAVIRADGFTLLMAAAGLLSGAVGWLAAMKLYVLIQFPLKNGKHLFGSPARKGLLDGWKAMEFTLGAFGGLGLSLCYCLSFDKVKAMVKIIEQNGGLWNPLSELEAYVPWVAAASLLFVTGMSAWQYFKEKKRAEINYFVCDLLERPFYSVLPLMLVMLGSVFTARVMTFFMLYLVMALKCAFDRFADFRAARVWQACLLLGAAAVFVGDLLLGGYSAWWIWFLCGLPYLVSDMIYTFRPAKLKKMRQDAVSFSGMFGAAGTVFGFFILQIAALYAIGAKLFLI